MIHTTSLSNLLRQAPWRLRLLHGTPSARVLWFTHGQGRLILNGRLHGIGVHNLIFVPPNHPVSLEPSAQTNGYLLEAESRARIVWPTHPLLLRIRDAHPQGEFSGLMDALQRERIGNGLHQDEAARAYATLISVAMSRQIDATPDSITARPKASQRLMLAFLQKVEAHHTHGWNVADYAQALSVTPTHLTRACKSQLGRSAATFLSERAEHAARLHLERSDKPIKEITAALGFNSAASFSRFIQTHTGKSPRDLRKSLQAVSA